MKKKRIKLGLALGSGGARGLIHIGVLKVLEENGIRPDCIAGTSMGAAIGAAYSIGYSSKEIAEITKSTDWKKIVDFTIPKSGIIKGELIENKIRKLLKDRDFKELHVPLAIVAYNLTKRKKVVFTKGNVSKAVRASISIPGIFSPTTIDGDRYIDGVVSDPTPFDIVRDMGADVVIAVDLYNKEKTAKAPKAQKGSLLKELKKQFILDELLNIRNYLIPDRWPGFRRKVLRWIFDKILYPAKVLRILAGRQVPEITMVMHDSIDVLSNNYAHERLKNANVDIVLSPVIKDIDWSDFDKVDSFVRIGEKAMRARLPELKKKLKHQNTR
jgi:predicted acylesterase/phospholipase RssA